MTVRAAIMATLAALIASAACSEREPPPPSPWVRTMTIADRRAWVTRCSGDEQVHVFEGKDRVAYSSQRLVETPLPNGSERRLQVSCTLNWDPRRGRLASLSVSIDASEVEAISNTNVTPYVELVMGEMTERDREAAIALRSAVSAHGSQSVQSRDFTVSRDRELGFEGWSWSISVWAN